MYLNLSVFECVYSPSVHVPVNVNVIMCVFVLVGSGQHSMYVMCPSAHSHACSM